MKNGIIYTLFKLLIDNLKYLSLVEWFKKLIIWIFADKNDILSIVKCSRIAVDLFIIAKWVLIILIMQNSITNQFLTILVWYLIYSNLYTYFYYHTWVKESLNPDNYTIDRVRRRFLTLMLSIGFSNMCFAYLVRLPYLQDFAWSNDSPTNLKSIWFSFANSLTAEYEYVLPNTQNGLDITITQLIISFVFLTIILGKSIPQTSSTT